MPPLPALRAFLTGLIDYAGLFPPATLAIEPALDLYGRYRTGPDAWMLGRFLIPGARLGDADGLVETVVGDAPVTLSVLGGRVPDPPPVDAATHFLASTEALVADARAFEAHHAGRVVVDAFEVRTAPALARDADALAGVLTALAPRLDAEARMAVEIPYLSAPDATEPAAHAVAETNARLGRAAFAVKFRCGGEGVPTSEALAEALTHARRAGVAFKATAGLHHPLRHETEDGDAHGFVNVFGGAVLAHVHSLSADDLAEILDSRDAAEWRLGDGLGWRSLSARPDQIAEARARLALAYGSCSFDEPRDDLREMGWLPPAA